MPAYTFRADGTKANGAAPISPGAPAGVVAGDLLLIATTCRPNASTLTTPTGWSVLKTNDAETENGATLLGRIADGGANDTPTISWSTGNSSAQIAAFSGDVYTDLATIVAHSAAAASTSNTVDIPNPAITITTDNCLVIGVAKKRKTATSNEATVTSPTGLNNRIGLDWQGGSLTTLVWDYTQQTTATNISASIWNQSVEESLPYSSLIVALKTAATLDPIRLIWRV